MVELAMRIGDLRVQQADARDQPIDVLDRGLDASLGKGEE